MGITRRECCAYALATVLQAQVPADSARRAAVGVILAPSNLGLRPQRGEPAGTWRAPQALVEAGLLDALGTGRAIQLERPAYEERPQPGTRLRNGQSIRAFSLTLANEVRLLLQRQMFPLVIGGDCSVLLGGLFGLRLAGGRGLIHIDGHSDFYQLPTAGPDGALGAVAGMDLALVSGRGEALLTVFPDIASPLARDADIIQVGQRDSGDPSDRISDSGIVRFTIQRTLQSGVESTARRVVKQLQANRIDRAWLHVDLDVLDQAVMPAVDSPGSPGFTYAQLSDFVGVLCDSGRIAGADFTIYDPDRDPAARYAPSLVRCIAAGIGKVKG